MSIGKRHGVPIAMASDAEGVEQTTHACLRQEHAQEITRYGGMQLHNISALMGGIAAQVSGRREEYLRCV